MGRIAIELSGSFTVKGTKYIGAMDRGHASAVAEAIEYLSARVMPQAIKQDHDLHEEGHKPNKGFGGRER